MHKLLADQYQQHIESLYRQSLRLLSEHDFTRLVIAAGTEQFYFRDDNAVPFRLNPYFSQWLDLPQAINSYLVIDAANSKPRLYYYLPEDIWHKPSPVNNAEIEAEFELINFADFKSVEANIFGKDKTAYIGQVSGSIADHVDINPEGLLNALDYYRAYKTDYEQTCLQAANYKAALGHKAAADAFYEGCSEFEIHQAYLTATRELENQQPYNSIIALNENAAVLHYPGKQLKKPAEHYSFLIDAGASEAGYAADISRSYAFEQNEFAEMVTAMGQLQLAIVKDIQVGKSYLDLHVKAHLGIAQVLFQFDLLCCSADIAVEQGVSSVFFPHGLGHYLGVQVHDKGGWLHNDKGLLVEPPSANPYLRLTRQIESEQVFTIEPGLYFIEALLKQASQDHRSSLINWSKVEGFMSFGGIRIEDNILVKKDNVINLTREAGLN